MDYMNPNDYWLHAQRDLYKGLNDDERMNAGCLQVAAIIGMTLAGLLLCAMLGSCTTTRYVPVTETHNVYHHTTDTILKTDSVIDRQTTVIREVDSATMARYGIQLQAMQRAWLVENDRLQRELSALRETVHDTIHVTDSIPYPVEVVREVERKRSAWDWVLMLTGMATLLVLFVYVVNKLKRFLPGMNG